MSDLIYNYFKKSAIMPNNDIQSAPTIGRRVGDLLRNYPDIQKMLAPNACIANNLISKIVGYLTTTNFVYGADDVPMEYEKIALTINDSRIKCTNCINPACRHRDKNSRVVVVMSDNRQQI